MITEILLHRPALSAYQQMSTSRSVEYEKEPTKAASSAFAEEAFNLDLSPAAQLMSEAQGEEYTGQEGDSQGESEENTNAGDAKQTASGAELSDEERKEVDKMQERDREVRTHEQAHLAAAGSYARGGIHLEYETGPDGRQYATGGHVNLDMSKEDSPEKTAAKAQTIQKAAMAPAEPSPKDRQVASEARAMAMEARKEIQEEKASVLKGEEGAGGVAEEKPDASGSSGGVSGRLEGDENTAKEKAENRIPAGIASYQQQKTSPGVYGQGGGAMGGRLDVAA
jgi:hypothetical protein